MQVSDNYHMISIPLNYGNHIDKILFFHGLEWFGVITSELLGYRPFITRQHTYYYPDLKKRFYLFFDKKYSNLGYREIFNKGLIIADNYLFKYNCLNKHIQTNARGSSSYEYEYDTDKKYIDSDGVKAKIHDPVAYAFDGKGIEYVHTTTNEELFCGRRLIDDEWKKFSTKIDNILFSYAVIIKNIDEINNEYSEFKGPFLCKKNQFENFDKIKKSIWFNDKFNANKMTNEDRSDEFRIINSEQMEQSYRTFIDNTKFIIYEPAKFDEVKFASLEDLLRLEDRVKNIGIYLEREGELDFFNDERLNGFMDYVRNGRNILPFENIKATNYYQHDLLGYFFSGLNGDRPYSQFLNYYNVLEMTMKENEDLRNLINDKNIFTNKIISDSVETASRVSKINPIKMTRKGGWNRDCIAEVIYKKIRNPIVHSRENSRINAFSFDEFDNELDFWVVFVRELARTIILSATPVFTGVQK